MALFCLCIAIILGQLPFIAESTNETRQGLLNKLLDPAIYDPTIAPNFNEDTPTNVTVQLYVLNIYSISEATMDYKVELTLRQTWVDQRLENNGTSERIELDSARSKKVWSPDTFFRNEKTGNFHTVTSENKLIHILKNGTVYYSARLSLTLACVMDLHFYPLDEQYCPIKLLSWAYSTDNILFHWHEQALEFENTELAQFSIVPEDTRLIGDVAHFGSGSYSRLTADILLSRKVGYYVIQVFIPTILIVVLSWVNFWLDETAVPARVSLGVVTVLTITTMSSGIRQTLPPVSYVKAIDVWMFVCQLFIFGALLEFAFVNAKSRHCRKYAKTAKEATTDKQSVPVGEDAERINAPNGTAEATGEQPAIKRLASTAVHILIPGYKSTRVKTDVERVRRADHWSRRIFPCLFFLFVVIFFPYVGTAGKE